MTCEVLAEKEKKQIVDTACGSVAVTGDHQKLNQITKFIVSSRSVGATKCPALQTTKACLLISFVSSSCAECQMT